MSVYVIAEIGINHNGSVQTAKRLIDAAVFAGADAVKLQKRTPEKCVPKDQWDIQRDTPWGCLSYIDYRRRMEFGHGEYRDLAAYCAHAGIGWGASAFDVESAGFLAAFDPPWIKVPSAKLTDIALLKESARLFDHVILSTGMSTTEEVDDAVATLRKARVGRLTLLHCHSAYPAPTEELNLRCIQTLKNRYRCEVGYSGHEYGIRHSLAAVALGAAVIERHITLDHDMWGTDHGSSVEPLAFAEMVRHIRSVEKSLGDGVRRVWDSEIPAKLKLRGAA